VTNYTKQRARFKKLWEKKERKVIRRVKKNNKVIKKRKGGTGLNIR